MCMWVRRDVSDMVHLDGDGVVCAAFDSGIVCYKGHQAPMHSAYARHDASRRHLLSSWCRDSVDIIGECSAPQACIADTFMISAHKDWFAASGVMQHLQAYEQQHSLKQPHSQD